MKSKTELQEEYDQDVNHGCRFKCPDCCHKFYYEEREPDEDKEKVICPGCGLDCEGLN